MEIVAEMEAACPPEQIFVWVEDLERYPAWLEIVTRAEPIEAGDAVWAVDLRGRVGPLARSKRLRMVRTVHEPHERVTFERRELDGRNHSPWTLDARVVRSGGTSRLTMTLTYGGGLFGPVLERVLRDEIERSRLRLSELVADGAPRP